MVAIPIPLILICPFLEISWWQFRVNGQANPARFVKKALLLVLEYPELPLHNNASELGIRRRVRKRDVSFGPRSEAGKRAWDTFMTLAETARKLGDSFLRLFT
jgi:hypothetical protein